MHRFALVFTLALVSVACSTRSGGGTPGTDSGPTPRRDGSTVTPAGELRIEPIDYVGDIRGGQPVTVDYRAFLTENGAEREVTAEARWTVLNPLLGTFDGARFTSATNAGGRTRVTATVGARSGATNLTLNLETSFVVGTAPADAPSRFDAAQPTTSNAPELVYPDDATLVPSNLNNLEFHFRTGGNDLFELRFSGMGAAVSVYFRCPEMVGGGCIYEPAEDVWRALSTAAAGNGPVTYTLRGLGSGSGVGASASRTIEFSQEPITGGLYYWNAGAGKIIRYEFGRPGAEEFLTTQRTGGICVGCHALSRDGSRIAVGTANPVPVGSIQSFDVGSRARQINLAGSLFPTLPWFYTWSPDNSELATGTGVGIDIRNGTTGAVITRAVAGGATMPDWSPDGNAIVYASSAQVVPIENVPGSNGASIKVIRRNGATWFVDTTIAPAEGGNNYYPAWAPDGAWVVYVRSPSNYVAPDMMGNNMPQATPDAELWAASSDGLIRMRLDRADGYAASWPKLDPTAYMHRNHPLFWFTWSDQRAYGLRWGQAAKVQLWMSAFDPTQAASGADASTPAFRLPFQDPNSGNHIAQWVTTVERAECTSNMDCGGELCEDGRCYAQPILY